MNCYDDKNVILNSRIFIYEEKVSPNFTQNSMIDNCITFLNLMYFSTFKVSSHLNKCDGTIKSVDRQPLYFNCLFQSD